MPRLTDSRVEDWLKEWQLQDPNRLESDLGKLKLKMNQK